MFKDDREVRFLALCEWWSFGYWGIGIRIDAGVQGGECTEAKMKDRVLQELNTFLFLMSCDLVFLDKTLEFCVYWNFD
jgi:hypothetical protein